MGGERETPRDPQAEAEKARLRKARKEREKAQARARAKKSYERRKGRNKGGGPQTSADPGAPQAAADDAAAGSEDGPLGKVLKEEQDAGAAAAEPTPEEKAAAAAIEQFGTPEKFAGFMARMQKIAEVAVRKSARGQRVIAALEWANEDGSPTQTCLMGVQLAWPWLEAGGFEFIALLGPGFMAALGGSLLFGPAIIVAMDEYEEHKAERAKKQRAGDQVVELNDARKAAT